MLGLDWEYEFEGNPIDPREESGPDFQLACSYCNQNGQCVSRPVGQPCVPDPEVNCSDNPSECEPADCVINPDGTETCTFIIDRVVDIAIDLAGADLPIMGFTEPSQGSTEPERVVNSVFQGNETVTDAQKVNEYVSWYLNGIIGRAEYDPPEEGIFGIGGLTEEGERRVVNFSGPLKRLLAFESQIVERIAQVDDEEAGDIRHDQIIGCVNLLNQPTHCYPQRLGVRNERLSDWAGALRRPPLQRGVLANSTLYWLAYQAWRLVNSDWRLFSYIPFSSTEDRKGEVEISEYTIQPPVSSDIVILHSAILNQQPAELFFAHMQEAVELSDILQRVFSPQDADLEADPMNISPPLAPLCDIAEVRTNPGDDLFATELTATVEYTAQVSCNYTYPGDGRVCEAAGYDCYGGNHEDYFCETYFNQVDCGDNEFCGENCDDPGYCHDSGDSCVEREGEQISAIYDCCPGSSCSNEQNFEGWQFCEDDPINVSAFSFTESCTNQVPISFRTITKTPLADRVWAKLVSGPAGVFRRLFPQIEDEEGRPIRRLWDIPAATDVVYRSLTGNVTVAGGNDAQLYFPHIGGVHEYFLNCIQKTLRPQGYGRGCITGPPALSHITGEGSCSTPPPPGAPVVGAGTCEAPTSGLCSPGNLIAVTNAYDGNGWDAHAACIAAIICNRESGGNPSAINCGCLTGTSVDYSVGLFQINLLSHTTPTGLQCHEAFEYSCSYSWCDIQGPIGCTILDQGVVDECADYYFNAQNNIIKAYQMSLGGTRWDPWAAGTSCATEIAACP